jgi:hypothetical protein
MFGALDARGNAMRNTANNDTRFKGVSSWTLQSGSLWGSKWWVYCRVLIVRL